MENKLKGGFTLPGEAGYEALTLRLAERWGADVIRDSDGTELSQEIIDAGYGIYSTICIIRDHNAWAKEHMDRLQQTILMSEPVMAEGEAVEIELMQGYYREQFAVNDSEESRQYWEAYDRTTGVRLKDEQMEYCGGGRVRLKGTNPWHRYTVNFFAYRIWEEISMYNHVTNNWQKEHLMQLDPIYPEVREYLTEWLGKWCEEHPATTVVRFTSLFYNFVWIWGEDERNRSRFTDWGSYDFTVSPRAFQEFRKEYGYVPAAEDFVHQGKRHVTHMPADRKKRDWMEFIHRFVTQYGKELVALVHRYGKQAYLFYDDSWVGAEPYGSRFAGMDYDGIIKCVFSGYEVRMCAGVQVPVHELRLHPYLFPVGLGGAPTFMEGGNPKEEARRYWIQIRRALLRCRIERIGLGGYLHLVEDFPEFVEYVEEIAQEFRLLKELHETGSPAALEVKAAVLHSWGGLRPWTLSGHFHESWQQTLIHINESLAGMPFQVEFISFEDILNGAAEDYQVIINAGRMGSAWSGGSYWQDDRIVEALTEWTAKGGCFIGVEEPGAVSDGFSTFAMAHVLGVDKDLGDKTNHGRWNLEPEASDRRIPAGCELPAAGHIFTTGADTHLLLEKEGNILVAEKRFGEGRGIYLSGFVTDAAHTRLLQNLMLSGRETRELVTDDIWVECAYFPKSRTLVWINNSGEERCACVNAGGKIWKSRLAPYEMKLQEDGCV